MGQPFAHSVLSVVIFLTLMFVAKFRSVTCLQTRRQCHWITEVNGTINSELTSFECVAIRWLPLDSFAQEAQEKAFVRSQDCRPIGRCAQCPASFTLTSHTALLPDLRTKGFEAHSGLFYTNSTLTQLQARRSSSSQSRRRRSRRMSYVLERTGSSNFHLITQDDFSSRFVLHMSLL